MRVLIGEDSELTSELEFSSGRDPYGVGERPLGTLGIVGPSRMEYEKIIPLVHFLGETLSRALAESFSGCGARNDDSPDGCLSVIQDRERGLRWQTT